MNNLHLIVEETRMAISGDNAGAPIGVPKKIGSTALIFRPRRNGVRRGETMHYEKFTENDLALGRMLAAAPRLFNALMRARAWMAEEKKSVEKSYGRPFINPVLDEANAVLASLTAQEKTE